MDAPDGHALEALHRLVAALRAHSVAAGHEAEFDRLVEQYKSRGEWPFCG